VAKKKTGEAVSGYRVLRKLRNVQKAGAASVIDRNGAFVEACSNGLQAKKKDRT